MEQLRDDQVGDLVVDRCAEEDDPLVQQTAVDVERPLPAGGLLDDHGYEWAHRPRFFRFLSLIPAECSNAPITPPAPSASGRPERSSALLRPLLARLPQLLARLGPPDRRRARPRGRGSPRPCPRSAGTPPWISPGAPAPTACRRAARARVREPAGRARLHAPRRRRRRARPARTPARLHPRRPPGAGPRCPRAAP